MFSRLTTTNRRFQSVKRLVPAVVVSVVLHAIALLMAASLAAWTEPVALKNGPTELVAYVHVAPAPTSVPIEAAPAVHAEPSSELAVQPEAGAGPASIRFNPALLEPAVPKPELAAGFQELRAPIQRIGLPPSDSSAVSVSENDYRGRGVIGGVGGGRPSPVTAMVSDSGSGGGGGGGVTSPARPRIYTAAHVELVAKLLNRAELPALLQRLYPPILRQAGIGGDVVAEFVIDAAGQVDPQTIVFVNGPNESLAEATRLAIGEFRWQAARRAGRTVSMLARMTITWTVTESP
jgi:protein TonB